MSKTYNLDKAIKFDIDIFLEELKKLKKVLLRRKQPLEGVFYNTKRGMVRLQVNNYRIFFEIVLTTHKKEYYIYTTYSNKKICKNNIENYSITSSLTKKEYDKIKRSCKEWNGAYKEIEEVI